MNECRSRLTAITFILLLALLGVGHLLHIQKVAALPATIFVVSNLNDSGAGSLRQAILDANSTPGSDVIQITAAGNIQLVSALPIINEALTVKGPGMAELAVVGGGGFRVFESTTVPLTISDLTVERGAPANDSGGGIRSLGPLTLTNVAVVSNSSPAGGGGVFVNGEVHIENGRFENNRALGSQGGGLWSTGSALVTNTLFISNTAAAQGGGATVSTRSTLESVHFEENHSLFANGGGLYASGIVTVSNAIFRQNNAFIDGGGMLAFGQANVYHTQFIENSCADQGGAMYVGSLLTVKQSAFVGNLGGRGGAIFHNALNGLLENSLFAENTATNAGDHLFLNSISTVTINHVTAVGSPGGIGTGIHITNSDVVLTNTIVASHTIGLNNLAGSINHDYLLFFANITDIQGSASGGSHNVSGDPRFIYFANDSYHLGNGSAAIDAGIDSGLLVDYDGHERPLENGFDIGFDEATPTSVYLPLVIR